MIFRRRQIFQVRQAGHQTFLNQSVFRQENVRFPVRIQFCYGSFRKVHRQPGAAAPKLLTVKFDGLANLLRKRDNWENDGRGGRAKL